MIPILTEVRWRALLPGQVSEICTIDPVTAEIRVVHRSPDIVFEAPNWTPDGQWLIVNAGGTLYRLAASGAGAPEPIEFVGVDDLNNDHVISPDGQTVYLSSEGDGHLYSAPIAGGLPVRISAERPGPFGYFALGISPDGETLAFTGADSRGGRPFVSNIHTMPVDGGPTTTLTDSDVDSIGAAYSPDGEWLYFNSERGSSRPGHAQLFRMDAVGGTVTRLSDGDRVDWFPKPSPDGEWVSFISFPSGTIGHEANVPVQLCLMKPDGSDRRTLTEFLGGQGTMNVSSWAPDSSRFAFVRYPLEGEQ